LFDAVVTLATLVSAGIMLLWGVNLDGVFGILISLVILKAGWEMLSSPVNELLGSRISPEFVAELKNEVMGFDKVYGVFDIIMNSYGPDMIIGSLHVNVPDTMTAREIHGLTREISRSIYEKMHVILTVGIYAIPTGDSKQAKLQRKIMQMASRHDEVMQVHAFFYYEEKKLVTLDIVPKDWVKDEKGLVETLRAELEERYPELTFSLVLDHNYSE